MNQSSQKSCNEESSKILRNFSGRDRLWSWVMSGPSYSFNARSMEFMDLKRESILSKVCLYYATHSSNILHCNSSYSRISFFIFSWTHRSWQLIHNSNVDQAYLFPIKVYDDNRQINQFLWLLWIFVHMSLPKLFARQMLKMIPLPHLFPHGYICFRSTQGITLTSGISVSLSLSSSSRLFSSFDGILSVVHCHTAGRINFSNQAGQLLRSREEFCITPPIIK